MPTAFKTSMMNAYTWKEYRQLAKENGMHIPFGAPWTFSVNHIFLNNTIFMCFFYIGLILIKFLFLPSLSIELCRLMTFCATMIWTTKYLFEKEQIKIHKKFIIALFKNAKL